MYLALVGLAAWGAALVWVVCLARAAGRADEMTALIAAAERDTPAHWPGCAGWPGLERIGAVRDGSPKLTDPQVYAVAQARHRLDAETRPEGLG